MKSKELNSISSTLLKGRITELKCELWFLEQGFLVSNPDLPYQYDMIVDIGKKLLKIQVKTSRLTKDGSGIEFNTSSLTHNNQGYVKREYSAADVDYFMTFYENDYYLIPYSECGTTCKKLRLIPVANGQVKNISFAKDYLAEKIVKELVE